MTSFELTRDVIRDAQERLEALGHAPVGDPAGLLGPKTAVAIQAFQRQRGLPITGDLDVETWNRLVEAGWGLGDRLLFLVRPHLRGDDIAALQESLALLGFNPGRIDGIFGVLTKNALAEFQRNCALDVSGELTRATLSELVRMSSRSTGRRLVTETHDAAVTDSSRSRLVVLVGSGDVADLVARNASDVISMTRDDGDDLHAAAALANELGAGLLLHLSADSNVRGLTIHYFESYRAHSVVGRALAETLARAILSTNGGDVAVTGMSLPILRETLMPALSITVGHRVTNPALAAAIDHTVTEFFDTPR